MLKEMSTQGQRPNVITYNLLLDYLCKNRNTTEARKIFDSIIEKGIQPNLTTYSILLNGYASKGDLVDMHDDRIADPTGLAAKVVGVRDWWARFERARTADRRRGGATVLRLLFTRLGLKEGGG